MTAENGKVRVWKQPGTGVYLWECDRKKCRELIDEHWSGASVFWEIAQHQADKHAAVHHRPPVSRDLPTPPGGTHYDWSETGMHLKMRMDD